MTTVVMTHVDLECGGGGGGGGRSRRGATSINDDENSVCFSDADDYSSACGSEGEIAAEEAEEKRRRASSSAVSDVSVEIENGVGESKVHVVRVERDCRICQLSLFESTENNDVAIELGCSCKNDLAAAHKNCAEAWFKIKGNKTCEICNSIARNVVGPYDVESIQHTNETHAAETNIVITEPAVSSTSVARSCINGHRLLNFLLACMVFAFVISWLFHFNIPS